MVSLEHCIKLLMRLNIYQPGPVLMLVLFGLVLRPMWMSISCHTL
jgi:hypothetical protein